MKRQAAEGDVTGLVVNVTEVGMATGTGGLELLMWSTDKLLEMQVMYQTK